MKCGEPTYLTRISTFVSLVTGQLRTLVRISRMRLEFFVGGGWKVGGGRRGRCWGRLAADVVSRAARHCIGRGIGLAFDIVTGL